MTLSRLASYARCLFGRCRGHVTTWRARDGHLWSAYVCEAGRAHHAHDCEHIFPLTGRTP